MGNTVVTLVVAIDVTVLPPSYRIPLIRAPMLIKIIWLSSSTPRRVYGVLGPGVFDHPPVWCNERPAVPGRGTAA
eukprot:9765048-Heterocapsa_arctica.AAC.1